jgi:hypothetical protein
MKKCPVHHIPLLPKERGGGCLACLGAAGGKATTEAKAAAARANGAKGGRPRKRPWYEATADKHATADRDCGHEWSCGCSACGAARASGYLPDVP